jgi:nucleoside-diphosphate-sugar epimerase
MRSDHREPLNLGQDRMISINELVDIVARIAGKRIAKRYNLAAPQGVRGRNSDNTRLRAVLGWEPAVSLEVGLTHTYRWIEAQLPKREEMMARVGKPSPERHTVTASP